MKETRASMMQTEFPHLTQLLLQVEVCLGAVGVPGVTNQAMGLGSLEHEGGVGSSLVRVKCTPRWSRVGRS